MKMKKRTVFGMAALAVIAVTLMFRGCDAYQVHREEVAKEEAKRKQEIRDLRQQNCEAISEWLGDAPKGAGFFEPQAYQDFVYSSGETRAVCNTRSVRFYINYTEGEEDKKDVVFYDILANIKAAIQTYRHNTHTFCPSGLQKPGSWCSTGN